MPRKSFQPVRWARSKDDRAALRGDGPRDGPGYGTQPGNAAACFTHVAICASSSSSLSRMSR